ncbi:DUF2797 domain-containing protein [Spartinivicinus poritis]|uniref:DUF2797 domain-containing protein n=1 Tax=Spartinivicinus poritis TaxID=2994640 RepID=A0ABT5UHN6_9GAMM|nr:DUF2797 domain-containing protein [Spartinivicinus sp. A2-2]MDE1465012.1 DUF2797 domain-containing protein [Spartinivicinus sp. A2-2]
MSYQFEHSMVGDLRKMHAQLVEPVSYQLPIGEQMVELNHLLNQLIQLEYLGEIHCIHCGRRSKKSFSQGYCYPCFKKLPQCDTCIMSPEKCHYHEGTCRDSQWADQFCMTDHIVYLANSTGLKVGITRVNQIPTRWLDQGAVQALPIVKVSTRQQSGLLEKALKQQLNDKTNWRALLKGNAELIDLQQERDKLAPLLDQAIAELQEKFGIQAVQPLTDSEVVSIGYPVNEYPSKIITHNFDKIPLVNGKLMGIKGQYLILDTGVLNIRKFTAYNVKMSW